MSVYRDLGVSAVTTPVKARKYENLAEAAHAIHRWIQAKSERGKHRNILLLLVVSRAALELCGIRVRLVLWINGGL
jgi:hypothetical protein